MMFDTERIVCRLTLQRDLQELLGRPLTDAKDAACQRYLDRLAQFAAIEESGADPAAGGPLADASSAKPAQSSVGRETNILNDRV